jgi:hypothetical protein
VVIFPDKDATNGACMQVLVFITRRLEQLLVWLWFYDSSTPQTFPFICSEPNSYVIFHTCHKKFHISGFLLVVWRCNYVNRITHGLCCGFIGCRLMEVQMLWTCDLYCLSGEQYPLLQLDQWHRHHLFASPFTQFQFEVSLLVCVISSTTDSFVTRSVDNCC